MTLDKFVDKVKFIQRELPGSDQIEVQAQFTQTAVQRVDKFLLAGHIENPKVIMNQLKRDMVRLLFHDIYIEHREEFYRYMMELRKELDFRPNGKADKTLKQMMALFD